MSLKKFVKIGLVLTFGILGFSCSSDNNINVPDIDLSTDAQIKSFSIDAKMDTANDSIAYPYFSSTVFSISSDGRYEIVNFDSMHYKTQIRTLKLTLEYTNVPNAVNLIYRNIKDNQDSIVTWNTTDSVKFFFNENYNRYFPKLQVIAPNGKVERNYTIDFRIHKINPDSVIWEKVLLNKNVATPFLLPAKVETKVVADDNDFYALANDGGTIKLSVTDSALDNLAWITSSTNLPANTIIQSFTVTPSYWAVASADGNLYYTQDKGQSWTQASLPSSIAAVKSIVGILPTVSGNTLSNEFLFVVTNSSGKYEYAKTSDFTSIIKVENRKVDVVNGFPITGFSSIYNNIDGQDYLVVTGGYDRDNNIVNKSFIIKNVASTSIEAISTKGIDLLPFADGITTFDYGDDVYALSSDSLSLYMSKNADVWSVAPEGSQLPKEMAGMNKPSIIVDDENYMWVFGGVSNKPTKQYSNQIWRGRLNKLIPVK